MKQSEAVRDALNSYYFQEGRRAKDSVTKQCNKVIKMLEERESNLGGSNEV